MFTASVINEHVIIRDMMQTATRYRRCYVNSRDININPASFIRPRDGLFQRDSFSGNSDYEIFVASYINRYQVPARRDILTTKTFEESDDR